MSEIIFVIEISDEGGYLAKALGFSIFTEAETKEELRTQIRDAVKCHFDADKMPKMIRLHFVQDELLYVAA
jgi:hypothetical protein